MITLAEQNKLFDLKGKVMPKVIEGQTILVPEDTYHQVSEHILKDSGTKLPGAFYAGSGGNIYYEHNKSLGGNDEDGGENVGQGNGNVTVNYSFEGNIIETETKELAIGNHELIAKEVIGYNVQLNTKQIELTPDNKDIIVDFELSSDYDWIDDLFGYNVNNKSNKGYYKYIGESKIVIIPENIQGTNMTSYYRMFENSDVEKVLSDNTNIISMKAMFKENVAQNLDVSELNTSNVVDASQMFSGSKTKQITGLNNFDTSNMVNMYGMFSNSDSLTLDIASFNTSKVTDMRYIFYSTDAPVLDVSNWDTKNLVNANYMFAHSKATVIDVSEFNMSNVVDISCMFDSVTAVVLDIGHFNISKVTNMSGLLRNFKGLSIDISNWDTSNVTDISKVFENALATDIDVSKWNTSKVREMSETFRMSHAEIVDVSNWDTSNVYDMSQLFSSEYISIIGLDKLNTSKVEYMDQMFRHLKAETIDISNFNTSNLIDNEEKKGLYGMFESSSMEEIIGLENFYTSHIEDISRLFSGMSNIKEIDLTSFDFSNIREFEMMFTGNFALNKIYVKNQADKDLLIAKFSAYPYMIQYSSKIIIK